MRTPESQDFIANARGALADDLLQTALGRSDRTFVAHRRTAKDKLPEFDDLRDRGRDIKDHTLDNLDHYLEIFEANVTRAGGHVHWARDAAHAREIILEICLGVDAKTVNKGKSMISEEIGLNDFLSDNGIEPVETDLGEYIIQIRDEYPSHIIAPAVHLTKGQIEGSFRETHTHLDSERSLEAPEELVAEARAILREKFFAAEVGITGANFLVAETGTSVIVTNEGNGDLSQLLPKVHIALASIEKVVPTLEDASTLIRLLARSATGQEISTYTTFSTGPRRNADPDGPEQFHVVLLDNGRSKMLGGEFQDMLRCIRCGACMNHCPVYQSVGGLSYGWVYVGPMGAVLTPQIIGLEAAQHLPNASTFCGRCEAVCPMHIPLPRMMRRLRERQYEQRLSSPRVRWPLRVWARVARHPAVYHRLAPLPIRLLAWLGRHAGRLRNLPMASGWTRYRDMPAPQGRTFQQQWAARQGRR